MALINKIREKTGVAVGIIALGLGFFVVGGDLLAPNSVLLGSNKQVVGEINGVEIGLQQYQSKIEELKAQYTLQNQKAPTEAEMDQIREQAWNLLAFEIAYQDEFEKIGLKVTDDEIFDMVQGENIHPALLDAFKNPQTGQFDRSQIIRFLQNIDQVSPEQKAMWYNFERNIGPDRLRTKYSNLIKAASFVTTEEAKRQYAGQNAKASVEYVYVPFYALTDSLYPVSDADLKEYLNQNRAAYKPDGLARLKYVLFPIVPTSEDSTAFSEELASLKEAFLEADNDTSFIRLNSDVASEPKRVNPGELPMTLMASASEVGADNVVLGPFQEGNSFKLYKMRKLDGDTNVFARASHILFRWSSESAEDKKAALSKANEILKKIQAGESFEEMARIHGTDGTSSTGGDLGWFGKGRMVPRFESAIFGAKTKGVLPKPVETEFGYHLIKVTEPPTNAAFYMATVEMIISASDNTRDAIFRKADYFASSVEDVKQFEEKASAEGLTVAEANTLRKSDKFINGLSNAREVVRWAFNDAAFDKLSDVKEVEGHFIVAKLTLRESEDDFTIEQFREDLTNKVRNQKKANAIIEKLKGLTGTMQEIAKAYGTEATAYAMPDVALGGSSMNGMGFEPKAIGLVFGLKDNEIYGPVAGENGVFLVKTLSINPASEISDYTMNKSQLQSSASSRNEYGITETIKDTKGIKDFRYKFF